jgi:hypothetical protein
VGQRFRVGEGAIELGDSPRLLMGKGQDIMGVIC